MQKPRPLTTGYHLVAQRAGGWEPKRALICGRRVYLGNDRQATA